MIFFPVVKEDPQIEESLLEQSDKRVQKAEDTDDEFDHFYDWQQYDTKHIRPMASAFWS